MTAAPPETDQRRQAVSFTVDGRVVAAPAGLSLAAALLNVGVRTLRRSPVAKAPRGAFCFIGVCQECVVWVDGRFVRACLEPVRGGMEVSLDVGNGG